MNPHLPQAALFGHFFIENAWQIYFTPPRTTSIQYDPGYGQISHCPAVMFINQRGLLDPLYHSHAAGADR